MGSSACGGGKGRPGPGVPAGEEAERPQEEAGRGEQTASCRAKSKVSLALRPSAKFLSLVVVEARKSTIMQLPNCNLHVVLYKLSSLLVSM